LAVNHLKQPCKTNQKTLKPGTPLKKIKNLMTTRECKNHAAVVKAKPWMAKAKPLSGGHGEAILNNRRHCKRDNNACKTVFILPNKENVSGCCELKWLLAYMWQWRETINRADVRGGFQPQGIYSQYPNG